MKRLLSLRQFTGGDSETRLPDLLFLFGCEAVIRLHHSNRRRRRRLLRRLARRRPDVDSNRPPFLCGTAREGIFVSLLVVKGAARTGTQVSQFGRSNIEEAKEVNFLIFC